MQGLEQLKQHREGRLPGVRGTNPGQARGRQGRGSPTPTLLDAPTLMKEPRTGTVQP